MGIVPAIVSIFVMFHINMARLIIFTATAVGGVAATIGTLLVGIASKFGSIEASRFTGITG